MQFQASVLTPSPETENKLVVNYAIDPRSINFERSDDGMEHAQVDCVVRVFTKAGGESPIKTEANRVNAALQPDVFQKISQSFFPCRVGLDLGEGHYYLRLAVRDSSTGQLGSYNAEVTVPSGVAASETKAGKNITK